MVNISRIVKMATSLKGTKGSFTLGKDALRTASGKVGKQGEAIFDFATQGLKRPAVDIAYKSSEKGFVVAHATIRDGQQVIGKGAVSVSGLGTEQSVVKYRLNMGEKGKIMQQSGWVDNTKPLTLDDVATSMTRKNGITTKTKRIGDAAASRLEFNENEFAKAADKMLGMPVASQGVTSAKNRAQGFVDKIQQGFRDLLAGKDVNLPKDKITEIKDKLKRLNTKKAPKWVKAEKVSQAHIDKLMKQGELNIKTSKFKAIKEGLKDSVRVPSGKEVPVKEYEDTLLSLIKSVEKAPDKQIEGILKQAKQMARHAEEQGVKLKSHDILEEMFKLYRI